MTSLPLHALVQVVEHLPTAVVVVDEDGVIVGASEAAGGLLLGESWFAGALDGVDLWKHLGEMPFAPRTTSPTPMVCGGSPHQLIGLADRFARLHVPADVATLAGEVAHDFNNLLGVIINFASLAAAELPAGSAGERDLREVITASKRGAVITQRLLDVGHAGQLDGQNGLVPSPDGHAPERDSTRSA